MLDKAFRVDGVITCSNFRGSQRLEWCDLMYLQGSAKRQSNAVKGWCHHPYSVAERKVLFGAFQASKYSGCVCCQCRMAVAVGSATWALVQPSQHKAWVHTSQCMPWCAP